MEDIKVELKGRDFVQIEKDGNDLKKVKVSGCSEFMSLMQGLRKSFGIDISKWPLPSGHSHSEILVRELILKLRGDWNYPYEHAELCHCRMISTQTVDQAIVAGAHTTDQVSRLTSASTACGTCRPEVEKLIDYRLGK